MKKSVNVALSSIAAAALLASQITACKNSPITDSPAPQKGTITVGIQTTGNLRSSRSKLTSEQVVEKFENAIMCFDAYVFDYDTGFLEASASSADGKPVEISNVTTAGQKRIVVLANNRNLAGVPSLPASGMNRYSDLYSGSVRYSEQIVSDAEIQTPTRGMLMTGENPAPFTVNPAGPNNINIAVRRVMSKVKLRSITFGAGVQLSDLQLFNITEAGIQRAVGASTIVTGDVTPYPSPGEEYWGGFTGGSVTTNQTPSLFDDGIDLASTITSTINALGTQSNPNIHLGDAMNAAAAADPNFDRSVAIKNVNAFWYVLPNHAPTGIATMLTMHGSYGGKKYYYSFEINSPDRFPASGGAGFGLYLKRNTVYNLDVVFHDLVGTNVPGEPGKLVAITVSVTPEDWQVLNQVVNW